MATLRISRTPRTLRRNSRRRQPADDRVGAAKRRGNRGIGNAVGVHLPLVAFGEGGARAGKLRDYVRAARELGFNRVSANDHLLWRRPWLDGLTALSAVVEHAAGMTMATSVALPAVRHPVVLAKSLAILAVLHAGPFIAGIGPGSGRADYAAVGCRFPSDGRGSTRRRGSCERCCGARTGSMSALDAVFAPIPDPAPQVWTASWGSRLRLRGIADSYPGPAQVTSRMSTRRSCSTIK